MELKRLEQSALSFLFDQQHDNGSWIDFNILVGESTSWITSYVLLCLSFVNESKFPKRLIAAKEKAAFFLEKSVKPNGGWGYNHNMNLPDDCDSTAHAILALSSNGFGVDDRSLDRLREFEFAPGEFRTFIGLPESHSWGLSHPEVGAIAVIALQDEDRAYALSKRLQSDLDKFNHWPSFWWKEPIYATYACSWLIKHFSLDELAFAFNLNGIVKTLSYSTPLESALSALSAFYFGYFDRMGPAITRSASTQLPDGSWKGTRFLRHSRSDCGLAWLRKGVASGVLHLDQNRVFTTATVLRSISQYLSVDWSKRE